MGPYSDGATWFMKTFNVSPNGNSVFTTSSMQLAAATDLFRPLTRESAGVFSSDETLVIMFSTLPFLFSLISLVNSLLAL